LSEVRMDSVNETLMALREGLDAIGLLPRSMEDEWGPGQMEFTFSPMEGLGSADAMVLFRSAVKQMCQRRGLLASFMCWPHLPNFFPSGWHLHGSLLDANGANVFASETDVLSPTALEYLAGVLEHAKAMTPFATPTLNGYHRFRPYSFAPDRIGWALENRGTLVRVQGGPGDSGTHLENRLGDPTANPYLYLAADIAAGLDGVDRHLKAPPPVSGDPYASKAEALPTSLSEALDVLQADAMYREQFGDTFVDYIVMMKRAEVARSEEESAASDIEDKEAAEREWEMREYLEFF
ncbi:MAG: glutamine synthetase, partial [Actinomycetota bacterium]|nr:glutamine synthetase [Actinomycetota bacterium]